jgi:hypothetical protein
MDSLIQFLSPTTLSTFSLTSQCKFIEGLSFLCTQLNDGGKQSLNILTPILTNIHNILQRMANGQGTIQKQGQNKF